MYNPYGEWQNTATNFRDPAINHLGHGNNGAAQSSNNLLSEKDDGNSPPPIPQRSMSITSPYSQSLYGQSPYYSGYSGLYGNPFQNYGVYGSGVTAGLYGSGNPMYGPGMTQGNFDNAFQTAQTFIGAFSSVSMMLESTLFAVQNSIRAITGVADQFGHLRTHLIHTTSTFLQAVKYYLNRILVLLRLRSREKDEAKYWMEAVSGVDSGVDSKRYASLVYFCVLIATPWFVWKFLNSLSSNHDVDNSWMHGSGRHYVAEVKFPFTARSNDELTVTANTIIRLAPKHLQPNVRGWLLAADGDKQGLVPANYIKILGKNRRSSPKVNGDSTSATRTPSPVVAATGKTLEGIFEEGEKVEETVTSEGKV